MENKLIPSLQYMPGDKYVPHHAHQLITCVPFFHVGDDVEIHQEGLIFDRNGDMYFTDIYASLVRKIDMKTMEMTTVVDFPNKDFKMAAVKFHKDGRMFLAGVDFVNNGKAGGIYYCNPDGTNLTCVTEGFSADDMVFDEEGGIYVTNFCGTPTDRQGTIEYITPDLKTRSTFIDHLAGPNGICFSPDYSLMWITETTAAKLHRIDMKSRRVSTTPVRFQGFFGPDSCSCDEDGNVYIAMARQGRVLVVNPNGFIIGEVITPRCEEGLNLGVTHPQVRPGTKELYITVHDITGTCGANIMYCGAFAGANIKQYQFL